MRAAGYFRFGNGKIQNLKSAAKRRSLEITISAKELENWWLATPNICVYCGQSPNEYRKIARDLVNYEGTNRLLRLLKGKFNRLKQALAYDLTIDRADNQRGYELVNLRKACWICNLVKGHFLTSTEMETVARRIRKEIEIGLEQATE